VIFQTISEELILRGKKSMARYAFSINLSTNLRGRDKESASYYQDACDLAKKHSKLKTIQLDEPVAAKLAPICQRFSDVEWKLELDLGPKRTFKYPVKFRPQPGPLFMDVLSEPPDE